MDSLKPIPPHPASSLGHSGRLLSPPPRFALLEEGHHLPATAPRKWSTVHQQHSHGADEMYHSRRFPLSPLRFRSKAARSPATFDPFPARLWTWNGSELHKGRGNTGFEQQGQIRDGFEPLEDQFGDLSSKDIYGI